MVDRLAAASTPLLFLLLVAPPAAGQWVPAANAQQTCRDRLLCTGSNLTWATTREYGAEEGCSMLASKGLKSIEFYGDSFMRHMYEGAVLTLTGAPHLAVCQTEPCQIWECSCRQAGMVAAL